MAEIFEKTSGPTSPERNVILDVREVFVQPFQADGWTDLRVGWFLSLTDETADDTTTSLSDTISAPTDGLPSTDYVLIGIVDRGTFGTFCGFSNAGQNARNQDRYLGDSMLVSSDGGIGTTNTNFWRPKNSTGNNYAVAILENPGGNRLRPSDGSQIHFAQVAAGAGGYATLLALRFQRPNATSTAPITMTVKKDIALHSGDILFNNDPSKAILENALEGFPTTVQTLGPFTLNNVPDCFWVYWPYTHSRLRVHSMSFVKKR